MTKKQVLFFYRVISGIFCLGFLISLSISNKKLILFDGLAMNVLCKSPIAEDSYARGLLVLEQCESTQPDENSKGLVELARSTLLFERFFLFTSLITVSS